MAATRQTHYDVLGVPREARAGDIARAYERLVAEFALDTTPPDARREARIREAFEVLSDPQRRALYDDSLDRAAAPPPTPDRKPRVAVAATATAVVLAAVIAWFAFGRGSTAHRTGKTAQQVQADAASSVGRMRSFDPSGAVTASGIAFTASRGVMATPCAGLAPGAQVVVTMGTRDVAARIAAVDETLGLCKLATEGAGSWPLPVGGPEPKAGDTVYAAGVNSAGEVVVAQGTVKRVAAEGAAKVLEATVPVAAGGGGTPILDVDGHVIAVAAAAPPAAPARLVILPAGWGDSGPP